MELPSRRVRDICTALCVVQCPTLLLLLLEVAVQSRALDFTIAAHAFAALTVNTTTTPLFYTLLHYHRVVLQQHDTHVLYSK